MERPESVGHMMTWGQSVGVVDSMGGCPVACLCMGSGVRRDPGANVDIGRPPMRDHGRRGVGSVERSMVPYKQCVLPFWLYH